MRPSDEPISYVDPVMDISLPFQTCVVPDTPRSSTLMVIRNSDDDGDLIARIAAGDHDAMVALHTQYGRAVFGLLQRLLPDRMTAEDVFQQVMLEAWQRAGSFDSARGSIGGWLLIMARSRAIDELRRRRDEPTDPAALATAPEPDDGLTAALGDWQIGQILDQLPHDERTIIEMRFRHELSQTEIAERIGLPLGTVKTRMNRGLGRLRDMMNAADWQGGE